MFMRESCLFVSFLCPEEEKSLDGWETELNIMGLEVAAEGDGLR